MKRLWQRNLISEKYHNSRLRREEVGLLSTVAEGERGRTRDTILPGWSRDGQGFCFTGWPRVLTVLQAHPLLFRTRALGSPRAGRPLGGHRAGTYGGHVIQSWGGQCRGRWRRTAELGRRDPRRTQAEKPRDSHPLHPGCRERGLLLKGVNPVRKGGEQTTDKDICVQYLAPSTPVLSQA